MESKKGLTFSGPGNKVNGSFSFTTPKPDGLEEEGSIVNEPFLFQGANDLHLIKPCTRAVGKVPPGGYATFLLYECFFSDK
jgi:hypothetical protein